MKDVLTVSINSPDKVIWEGRALSVSSTNSAGNFDVLPHHANFITIIENQPLVVQTGTKALRFTFPVCLMYARDNYVYAYTL
jgi:F0F1-type ATP synthase epsilon subunit